MSIEIDLRVGDWLVQPRLNRIAGRGLEHQVEPKVLAVLLCLAEEPGAVVSRDQLLSEVWPDTVVVDTAVFRAISELRRILDDDPKEPRVIETVRKRGYRLIAPVERVAPRRLATEAPGAGATTAADTGGATRSSRLAWSAALLASLAVALVATAALRVRSRTIEPAPPGASWPMPPTVVASSPALEFSPALSPDGSSLAFVQADGEDRKIRVKLAGDAEPRLLNSDPRYREVYPSWSPDGREIAFWRLGEERQELAVMPVLGGPARILARTEDLFGHGVSWSPDGRWIASAWQASRGGPRAVFLVEDSGGGEIRRLTQPPEGWFGDSHPAFSPDGRQVAFLRSSAGGQEEDIYLVPAAGGEPRRLTFDRKPIRGLAWRRDGEHLIFASMLSDLYALWQLSLSTGELSWTGIKEARYPTVARHDDIVAYEHAEREINVWEADLTTRSVSSEPVIRSTRIDGKARFRPDGKAIVFTSDRTGHFEIWTSDRDGGNLEQITRLEAFTSRPRWSPDGRRIAFQADVEGNHDVYVADGLGSPPRRLTDDPASDQAPSWSSDGRFIYFTSFRGGDWRLWRIPSGGGEPAQVTRGSAFISHASSDGRFVYFAPAAGAGLWRVPAAGGDEEELVLEDFPPRFRSDWQVAGGEVIYGGSIPRGTVIVAYDPESETSELLIGLPPGAAIDFSLSHDRRFLLFSQTDRRSSDIYQVLLPAL